MKKKSDDLQSSVSTTETTLLEAAIELYGKHGTQAVSLNQIRKHAEIANEAAIRYYFRNKQGLIAKSLDMVAVRILPSLNLFAEQLEGSSSALDVRTVLMNFGLPFAMLYEKDRNAVSFLGSLIKDEGDEGQKLLSKTFGEVIVRYERLLARALPKKSPELIHAHFFLAINLLIHGLNDIGILNFMPTLSGKSPAFYTKPDFIVEAFLDFVCAGICSEATGADTSAGLTMLSNVFSKS